MRNPKIRFKNVQGTDFPDWSRSSLGLLCQMYQPTTLSKQSLDDSGPYAVYGANGIIGKHSQFNHADSEVVVSCRGANCGSVQITKPCSWINGNAMVVHPRNRELLKKEFLNYLLSCQNFQRVTTGGAQPQITRVNLSDLMISIPSFLEQQKIASFFSTLDQKIELNERKLEALEKLKKGLMKQIFNQKISFHCDSGQKFEPWHEAKLKLFFAKISSGKSQKSKNGTYPLYGATGVIGKTNDDPYDGEKILVARVGSIGKVNFITESVGISDNTLILSQPNPGLNLKWLFFYFENFELTKLSSGSSQKLITSTQLKELSVYMPCIEEQQKISALFSSLDNKIKLFKHRNLLLHQLKRGLMQQMFV